LVEELNPNTWDLVFLGQQNDAIVPLASELNSNAFTSSTGIQFPGYVHSVGTEDLGFSGPSVQDAGAVPMAVIGLLNTPITGSAFSSMNP
jgi:hypothetical protein